MRREIIDTGKSVEDAINSACEKLGCQRENVEWKIIDLPKKTFLGLKVIPAKVMVWIETPEEEKPPVRKAPERQPERAQERQPMQKQADKLRERAVRPAPAQERPARMADARLPRPQAVVDPSLPMTAEVEAKANMAKAYLESICRAMDIIADYVVRVEDGGICIEVQGAGLGAIIGRRGETLDALQYLAGLVANRLEGEYLRITVDCGDYRTKRRSTLESLAKKLSAQVLKTNLSKTLEPMNPFERRIIHATVSEIEGVSSTSIGEEPNRRVVITTPTARRGSGRSEGADAVRSGSGDRGGNRSRVDRPQGDRGPRPPRSGGGRPFRGPPRERRESTLGGTINTLPQNIPAPTGPVAPPVSTTPAAPKKTPESAASDKPLYAKLDLE